MRESIESLHEARFSDEQVGIDFPDHRFQPQIRQQRIEWHKYSAGFQHRDDGSDRVDLVIEENGYNASLLRAAGKQQVQKMVMELRQKAKIEER